jgi:hypothetical protein
MERLKTTVRGSVTPRHIRRAALVFALVAFGFTTQLEVASAQELCEAGFATLPVGYLECGGFGAHYGDLQSGSSTQPASDRGPSVTVLRVNGQGVASGQLVACTAVGHTDEPHAGELTTITVTALSGTSTQAGETQIYGYYADPATGLPDPNTQHPVRLTDVGMYCWRIADPTFVPGGPVPPPAD